MPVHCAPPYGSIQRVTHTVHLYHVCRVPAFPVYVLNFTLVPDARLSRTIEGRTAEYLHDLKVLHCGAPLATR
eukprot:2578959-Prymnesium_polylepis.1